MLKVGDIVKHKLSGEVLRILKLHESVAVCQHPPAFYKNGWQWIEHDRYICQTINLDPHPEGKVIFDWIDQFDNKYACILRKKQPGEQLSLI